MLHGDINGDFAGVVVKGLTMHPRLLARTGRHAQKGSLRYGLFLNQTRGSLCSLDTSPPSRRRSHDNHRAAVHVRSILGER